ncbi:MAG: uracil-DNA glycosylase, partial [Mycobacterium sp.]
MQDVHVLVHPNTGQAFDSPVQPGSGWPGDPATPQTPVAADAAHVATLAGEARAAGSLAELDARS